MIQDWLYWLESYPPLLLGSVTLLSLLVGSFLNVVIHRLPIMMERQWRSDCEQAFAISLPSAAGTPDTGRFDLIVPRSHCPRCQTQLVALDNIPLVSWLLLKGRCRHCGQPIPIRYPLVELLTALLGCACALRFGLSLHLVAALLLTFSLISLAIIDLDRMLLPDQLTLPLLWIGLLLNLDNVFTSPGDAVLGAAAGYLLLWSLFWAFKLLTGKEGMGYGDFKLLAALGAWFGWQSLPLILLLSSVVGAVSGIGLQLLRRHLPGHPIPFGPFLAMAGWVYLLWGGQIGGYYLSHFIQS